MSRRSRWGAKPPPPPPPSASGSSAFGNVAVDEEARQAAIDRVSQLAAKLAADGAEKEKERIEERRAAASKESELIVEKLGLNHVAAAKRALLTKKATQADVSRRTGAVIVTKGSYQPPSAALDPENPPLHLEISGKDHVAVGAALRMCRELLTSSASFDAARRHSGKVFIGIPAPASFGLIGALLGRGGQYVKYIKRSANCQVVLAGRGCGVRERESNEELHFQIDAHTADGLQKAEKMAHDLIDTVRKQFEEWQRQRPVARPPPPRSHSRGGGAVPLPHGAPSHHAQQRPHRSHHSYAPPPPPQPPSHAQHPSPHVLKPPPPPPPAARPHAPTDKEDGSSNAQSAPLPPTQEASDANAAYAQWYAQQQQQQYYPYQQHAAYAAYSQQYAPYYQQQYAQQQQQWAYRQPAQQAPPPPPPSQASQHAQRASITGKRGRDAEEEEAAPE